MRYDELRRTVRLGDQPELASARLRAERARRPVRTRADVAHFMLVALDQPHHRPGYRDRDV